MILRDRPLVKNILLLFSSQSLSYLVPLATTPYLMRTLGIAGFGVYTLALAISGYLQVSMEYGFGLSATRDVARIKDNHAALWRLFWDVTWCKLTIGILGSLLLLFVIWMVPTLHANAKVHAFACAGAFASAFFPTWLLQGMEKMKDLARLSLFLKVANAIFIFLTVHHSEHLARLLLWMVFANGIFALEAHRVGLRSIPFAFNAPSFGRILGQLRTGAGVFFSHVGFLLYSNTNVVILSLWQSSEVVGAYAISEKIMRSAAMMTSAISQAIFPISARYFSVSVPEGIAFLRKVLRSTAWLVGIGCLILAIFASPILQLFSGHVNRESVVVLQWFAFIPLSIFLCNLYGSQVLLALRKDRIYLMGTCTAGLFGIAMQVALIPVFGALGAAISLSLSEILLLVIFAFQSKKLGIVLVPRLGV